MKKPHPLILIVDDDRTSLIMLETILKQQNYEVIQAANGQIAKDLINEHHTKLHAILLDRIMPDIDGIEIAHWLNNSNLSKVPIIMQTSADKPGQVKEGVDAGIFYYLTKPIAEEVLKSVVASAVKEAQQHKILINEMSQHKAGFKLMHNALFRIYTLEDAENLACFVAHSFPDPYRILPGIAELLVNAIEHGNYGITYEEKTELILKGAWREEVDKRASLERNKTKFAELLFNREGDKYIIKIADQGDGFNWKKFMTVDQSRALDNHGRGIARANMLFTSLEYSKQGNMLVAMVDKSKQKMIKW
jgi:two-component system cell cycle response regulator